MKGKSVKFLLIVLFFLTACCVKKVEKTKQDLTWYKFGHYESEFKFVVSDNIYIFTSVDLGRDLIKKEVFIYDKPSGIYCEFHNSSTSDEEVVKYLENIYLSVKQDLRIKK